MKDKGNKREGGKKKRERKSHKKWKGIESKAVRGLLLPAGRGAVGSFAAQAGSVCGAAGGGTAGAQGKMGVEKLAGRGSQRLPKEAMEVCCGQVSGPPRAGGPGLDSPQPSPHALNDLEDGSLGRPRRGQRLTSSVFRFLGASVSPAGKWADGLDTLPRSELGNLQQPLKAPPASSYSPRQVLLPSRLVESSPDAGRCCLDQPLLGPLSLSLLGRTLANALRLAPL